MIVTILLLQRITMSALAAEIARQTGSTTDSVRYQSDAALEAAFGAHPALATPAAEACGFAHDGNIATLVSNALEVIGREQNAL